MTESESTASAEFWSLETTILNSWGRPIGRLPRRVVTQGSEPSLEEHWEERQRKTKRKKRKRVTTSTAESHEGSEEKVKPFAIDPFYQRSSVDIAFEVGTTVLEFIDSLIEFFECIQVLAHGNGSWPRWYKLTDEMIDALSLEIPEWLLNKLTNLKDKELPHEDFEKQINNLLAAQCLPIFDSQIREEFIKEIKVKDRMIPCYVDLVLYHRKWPIEESDEKFWVPPEWRQEKPFKVFADCMEKVKEACGAYWKLFKKVEGWWIADSPPAIDPTHTSIVEILLYKFNSLVSDIECRPKSKYLGTLCRFLDLMHNPFNFDSFIPPLRCEIATMTRRLPPTEDICTKGARITSRLRGRMNCVSRKISESRIRNRLDLLENWNRKSEGERAEAIDTLWKANPLEKPIISNLNSLELWHKPKWDNQTRTLEYGGSKILTYKSGPGRPANKQWEVLQAFQKNNWDDVIEFRLEGNGDTNDTIYQLNAALGDSPITFHCIEGKRIRWSKTPREASQDKKRQLSVNTPYAKIEKSS